MDYYYKESNNVIGTYRGYEVFLIDFKKFTPELAVANEQDCIFAVKENPGRPLALVRGELQIGEMTRRGDITAYRDSVYYRFYEKPKAQVIKEEPKEPKRDEITEIRYEDYTKTVDDFFEGLHELWKEMEV